MLLPLLLAVTSTGIVLTLRGSQQAAAEQPLGTGPPTVAAATPTPSPSPSPTETAPSESAAPRPNLVFHEANRWRADPYHPSRLLPAEPRIVRGVYSTRWSFAGERWDYLMDLVRTTEVNALVIDVKDDWGDIAWTNSSVAVARDAGADAGGGLTKAEARRRIRELRDAGGYPIARVVCFKDHRAPQAHPELAIHTADGGLWQDRKGLTWLDANNRDAWEYLLDVSREAADIGFLEIQFDYVRFPTDGNTGAAVYANDGGLSTDAIRDFLRYMREELHKEGVRISADIFGLTTYRAPGTGDGDGTGQLFEDVIAEVDYVSPMVYASHYYPGNYGLANPEANPYVVVKRSMGEAQQRVEGYRASVRPWLEDFSLTVPHHPSRVSAQLEATYENGIESWLLWNAANRYSVAALDGETRPKAAVPEGS